MQLDVFLRKIDQALAEFAADALRAPQGKEAFDYGRSVGVYAGLEQARQILIDTVRDADARDRDI